MWAMMQKLRIKSGAVAAGWMRSRVSGVAMGGTKGLSLADRVLPYRPTTPRRYTYPSAQVHLSVRLAASTSPAAAPLSRLPTATPPPPRRALLGTIALDDDQWLGAAAAGSPRWLLPRRLGERCSVRSLSMTINGSVLLRRVALAGAPAILDGFAHPICPGRARCRM